jgi:hypothetical protein
MMEISGFRISLGALLSGGSALGRTKTSLRKNAKLQSDVLELAAGSSRALGPLELHYTLRNDLMTGGMMAFYFNIGQDKA